jgi:hypothetical protein
MTYAEEMLQHKAVELTVLDQNAPMRCLPQVPPTASHEYLCCLLRVPPLPPTSTYATSYEYLLPTPAFSTSRPAQMVLWAALPQPNPFPAAILYLSMTTRSSSGPKDWRWQSLYISHTEGDNFLQKALCAKDRGHSNDTFGNRRANKSQPSRCDIFPTRRVVSVLWGPGTWQGSRWSSARPEARGCGAGR